MTISYKDGEVLYQKGFTEEEITFLADAKITGGEKDGQSQEAIDLGSEAWRSALEEHNKVQEAYFKANPDDNHRDYDRFIDQWRRAAGFERDPWIWIDQQYFRKQVGAVTKSRWEEAYKAVGSLRRQMFID